LGYGIVAPAGTPANLVNRLNAEIVKAMNSADVTQRLKELNIEPRTSTPEEFAQFIREQTPYYAQIIKDAGIQPN
jgi:tripartite-type tricarboxylate transporter receptor subunit TctC